MPSPDAVDPKPVEAKRLPEHLPPVEAPTAAFIMQLFLIPLAIVSIVVLLWLSFSWLAQAGRNDPKKLVEELRRGTDVSWQSAYTLAEILRSPDPQFDAVRQDHEMAKELAALLEADVAQPLRGGNDKGDSLRIKRRMFLSRSLGSFHVLDGAPLLARLANYEKDPLEVSVRLSALEGLATLARNVGPEVMRQEEKIVQAVIEASRATDDSATPTKASEDGEYQPRAEVRAVAAFTLGVIGGEEARARLTTMLNDPYASARYNAATGLSRQGDEAAIPVLKEMLSPDNNLAAKDESTLADKDRKRISVLVAGIQGTMSLAEHNPKADMKPLMQALKDLAASPLDEIKSDRSKIRILAVEAYRRLEKRG
ncbi:HEAT repeat domain-containing protein [Anatilimnocola sp. NA78]|uniref:HEAT repeat domain-containing protein n=1 Tax=Anatilimnocola sp. NA78 TaxID=3415683 RepID=UPI003CE542A4